MTQSNSRTYRLGEIVARLGGELIGDPGAEIRRMATLESAGPGDLSFLSHPRYRRQLRGTRASAVILARDERDATALPRILCEDPYVYFARAAQLLSAEPRIGKRAVIHSGAVIGADGFGMAPDGDRWIKIPQTGRVIIGDDVEIGANTTIDRGALDDTVIEDGVKLDNQIQIGHNVRVGAHTAMAGCVAVAGSTRIGRHCAIGGAARIIGHLEIADRVTISAAAVVTKSITRAGVYTGVLPSAPSREWARTVAHLRGLDRLVKRVRELERRLSEPRKKKR